MKNDDVFLSLPHREKDRLVQKHVYQCDTNEDGFYQDPEYGDWMQIPHYSTDLRSAWKLANTVYNMRLSLLNHRDTLCVVSSGRGLEQWWGIHTCPEIAIVLAVMSKVGYFSE